VAFTMKMFSAGAFTIRRIDDPKLNSPFGS
jgi:hypothetical protein